ncbi:MAG: hypothetical protein HZA15_12755 [Nitrospirae bacterium]|nr:hypothetical protein [Nitrospirota bacterium]
MAAENAMQIVDEVIEAHGGMEYWNSLEALDAEISASGFLFTAKQRPVLKHMRMRALTTEPGFFFYDFPKPGQTGELIGNDEVRILDSSGNIVAQRKNPREAFRGIRRLLFWDDLDFMYFGGYATWNYLTAPFILARKGFLIETLEPLQSASGQLTRLHVTFPPDIPTHSREQIFCFDDQRLLRRLDYTAEVVGGWAHAAHLCEEYRTFDRLRAPTDRRVLPLLFGHKPLPGPILVELKLHMVRPVLAV